MDNSLVTSNRPILYIFSNFVTFYEQDNSPMYKTGYFGQFSAVFKRSIFQVIRQPDQLRIKAIQTIVRTSFNVVCLLGPHIVDMIGL